MSLSSALTFVPLPMERVWGGRHLESLYGKTLPRGIPIGESWEIVDRPEAQSIVHSGPWRGTALHDLWTHHRREIFGPIYEAHPAKRFPILIKLLDACDRLSLQVHPPAPVAQTLGAEPKTEMWYFASTRPGASIHAGLKKGITRPEFEILLRNGQVEEAIPTLPVETGNSIFIPSGRLHAIGGGSVIVEIQQNSDTTYRVFDWNRRGLDGAPRKLHIKESLASIHFEDFEPSLQKKKQGVLADCDSFTVEKILLPAPVPATQKDRFSFYSVLTGAVTWGDHAFRPGAFFLAPAFAEGMLVSAETDTSLLRCTLPVA